VTEFVTADDIKFNDGPCSEQAGRVASDIQNQADPSVNCLQFMYKACNNRGNVKPKGE